MMRRADRDRARDLVAALGAWSPDAAPATTWLLPALRELLDASFVGAYRPAPTEEGWGIDFMEGAGADAEASIRLFRQWATRLPASERFIGYNPFRVAAAERNRVFARQEDLGVPPELIASLYTTLAIPEHKQIRVLICDGPRLLCWLGATRAAAYTPRDAMLLQRLARPVRDRLRLERTLRPPWASPTAIEVVLEAVARPAFILGPRAAIVLANRAGRAALERDRRGVVGAIGQSMEHPAGAPYRMTRLAVPGYPSYVLAIAGGEEPPTAAAYA